MTGQTRSIERHCDVAIIGGSAAGLAAGLQLGRQRRSVIVIDAGEPRNAPAAHMHSYLGHEGVSPDQLLAIAREEVRSYGTEILTAQAMEVNRGEDGRFRVALTSGGTIIARRILAATGLVDVLPDIDGLDRHWGSDVIHCPFCHGYEARDQRIVQIITHPMGLHTAGLFRQLSEQLTLVLHDGVTINDPAVLALRSAGVSIVDAHAQRIIDDETGCLTAVELTDSSRIAADAVVIGTRFRVRDAPFVSLDITTTPHPSGLGDVVETNPSGETSVPGIYAAGNVTDPSQQVLQAAANGSWVAGMIAFSLAHDDIESAVRSVSSQFEWEHRYSGKQVWSGNPNGTLVNEASSLAPGRALDVGAGEGGDAVWLAEHGWQVTATDIAQNAIDQVAEVAMGRGLPIEAVRVDANSPDPFSAMVFDLVTSHYGSIPRTPDRLAIANILNAVAPGGTLLIVAHDPEPMRAQVDPNHPSRMFDSDAYTGIHEFVAALTDSDQWRIERHEKVPRPPGAATASHHVDDVVLRARRQFN